MWSIIDFRFVDVASFLAEIILIVNIGALLERIGKYRILF